MTALCQSWRKRGESLGFVPTMGALHAGHASLIRRARKENKRVAVSIFVNPTQFGPTEDFSRYPRTLLQDRKLCAGLGVDALYLPRAEDVYPKNFCTSVSVQGLSDRLCGAFRPGHFKGVATVVLKLFETTRPVRAYFGEKDFQQLQIIRRMVWDLDLAVKVVACPTIRDKDGLALSSRNRHLSPSERALAPALYGALHLAAGMACPGRRAGAILAVARRKLLAIPGLTIDYVSAVDCETLENAKVLRGSLRLAAAIRLGAVRLIDNIPLSC